MVALPYPLVVVGGGVAGLLASLLEARSGRRVVLVEAAAELGGLLRSRALPTGHFVDHGTHFMADTGVHELDALLRGLLAPDEVNEFAPIRAGTFAFGRRNDACASLDIRGLGRELEALIVSEALCSSETPSDSPTLRHRVEQLFGPTAQREVFEPILRKLTGVTNEELDPDALKLFSLARLVALDPAAARRLKATPHGDARFGYHTNEEGRNPAVAYYPRSGGIGRWTRGLVDAVRAAGVEVRLETLVKRVCREADGRILLGLSDGTELPTSRLVWSVPLGMLLRALGEEAGPPPTLRASLIEHFVFDRPFVSDAHYLHAYGPDVRPFRVTLYPNFTRSAGEGFACTVETLLDPKTAVDARASLEETQRELARMGLLALGAQLLHAESHLERAAFPVLTPAYRKLLASQRRRVEAFLPECVCIGKATGKDFFMVDVLRETWARCHASPAPVAWSELPQASGLRDSSESVERAGTNVSDVAGPSLRVA
jgi:glycine/D-amino acid oxidase-like deaminating enzyme